MTKTQQVLLAIAILVVGCVAGVVAAPYLSQSGIVGATASGGPVFYSDLSIAGNLFAGPNFTQITSKGVYVGTTQVGGGTLVSKYVCSTATWNPAPVATSSQQTLDISTPGVTLGDVEFASLATSTQGLSLEANASTTATSSVILSNNSAAAVDIATTTVKVCYTH